MIHTVERINQFNILRDDMVVGGTKRRAMDVLLKSIADNHIYYAGTVMGHGALALSQACRDQNKQAHIYICGDENNGMIEKLRAAGAAVHLCPPMPVDALYDFMSQEADGYATLPPAFDMPEFETALANALTEIDVSPYSEIWTTSVTSTLTRALKHAFPGKPFKTVSVVKSGAGDFTAPEKYHQPAKSPPPYPSCRYTDAKLWQFASLHAAPDALIWNTAG